MNPPNDAPPPLEAGHPLAASATLFIKDMKAGKCSPSTARAYDADIRGIIAVMTDQLEREPTSADLKRRTLIDAFAVFVEPRSNNSAARCWSTWNKFCNWLVLEQQIDGNPMAAVPRAKAEVSETSNFSDDDMSALFTTLSSGPLDYRGAWQTRDLALIATIAGTGLRAAETIDTRIGWFGGEPGERTITAKGKGRKVRTIPIDPRLEVVIGAYLRERVDRFPPRGSSATDEWGALAHDAPLWVTTTNEPFTIGRLEYLVRLAYEQARIERHRSPGALIHALRHTMATGVLRNGATIEEVRQLLGHANTQTTTRYTHATGDELRTAVAANPALQNLPRNAR